MANTNPARVSITAVSIKGDSVASLFNNVIAVKYDFIENTVNIVDSVQGSFYFGYAPVTTVTQVITNGVTVITIS